MSMARLLLMVLGSFLVLGSIAEQPRESFTEAPVIRSKNGVVSLHLVARINPRVLGPAFYYAVPQAPYWLQDAPTLEVRPGEHIRIDYRDLLPPILSDDAHGLPDDTNLHFHGLTASPNPPGDDVLTTTLSPLGATRYDVRIANDQPPGVYWYHPHAHHETSWQVGNGMAGAIVVDGIANAVPSVAGLRERLIVVRQVYLHPDNDAVTLNARICGLNHLTPRARIAYLRAAFRRNGVAADAGDETKSTVVTLNGQRAGAVTIGIQPGERELFRVINATPKRNLVLAVDGEPLELIGRDGVPLGYLPGSERTQSVSRVTVPPGGRAEFVVTGLRGATTLRSLAFDAGPKGDPNPAFALASLVDDGGSLLRGDPRVAPSRAEPVPANDFYRTAPPAPVKRRTVRLSENGDGTRFYINKRAFEPRDRPMFVARSGTTEEWTLVNESQEVHTFHTHQVHFVVESEDARSIPLPRRHWFDTYNVPYERGRKPGTVKILIDFRDPLVRGTFVFHCHILDHEDGGMMAKVAVI
jgi:suppressor of ftsI